MYVMYIFTALVISHVLCLIVFPLRFTFKMMIIDCCMFGSAICIFICTLYLCYMLYLHQLYKWSFVRTNWLLHVRCSHVIIYRYLLSLFVISLSFYSYYVPCSNEMKYTLFCSSMSLIDILGVYYVSFGFICIDENEWVTMCLY